MKIFFSTSRNKSVRASKIRKRQKVYPRKKRVIRHRKYIHLFVILSVIIGSVALISIFIKSTIFSSRYTITQVTYAAESVEQYDDPSIYNMISDSLLEKNYFWMKWYQFDDIKKNIMTAYPLIEEIEVTQENDATAHVTILFTSPTLVFRTPSQRVATYQQQLYPLLEKNNLGNTSLEIELPRYTSWYTTLHGIFHHIDEEKLYRISTTIIDTLGSKNIQEFIYLPGGQLIFVSYKSKRIYFNLQQDINAQLAKLIDFENWSTRFEQVSIIDVWSSDDIIVRQ